MAENRSYYLEERQELILSQLEKDAIVRVADLSAQLGVSTATIRKDIRSLEHEGKLRRTHGGAIKPAADSIEMNVDVAASRAHAEKVRIGRQAAQLVSDGDTFFVQSGTTCTEFVRALRNRRNITMITSDYAIAMLAEQILKDSSVIALGGTLRMGFHYAQGSETLKQLESYYVPTAYMCCNAFSFEHGFTAHRLEQAEYVRTQIRASERHIMLLDSTKMGSSALTQAASLSEIDCLITDSAVNDATRTRFLEEAPSLEVIYA